VRAEPKLLGGACLGLLELGIRGAPTLGTDGVVDLLEGELGRQPLSLAAGPPPVVLTPEGGLRRHPVGMKRRTPRGQPVGRDGGVMVSMCRSPVRPSLSMGQGPPLPCALGMHDQA
jgi:hypothetical protein